jgi:hypothetical protein
MMSLKNASRETGLTIQNIRSALKILENFKMIKKSTQEVTKQATIISICKYGDYQKKNESANTLANTVPTQSQHSPNTVPTIDNNVKKGKKGKNVNNKYPENSVPFKIANFLFQNILKNKPDFLKPNIQEWASDADKMMRLDGRDLETVKKLIAWCQADDFERANVLSIAKLRKRFDSLEIKMNRPPPKNNSGSKEKTFAEVYEDMKIKHGGEPNFQLGLLTGKNNE